MNAFSEKLQKLRKEKGLSQEGLAEMLDVSRQAVSRWESGLSYPETEKIITMSEIFGVTVDSLLKEGDLQMDSKNMHYEPFWLSRGRYYEYKSKKTLFGLPLVHVIIGLRAKKATGVIAIGNISSGIISIGFISYGLLSIGLLNAGILGFGIISIALLFSVGVFSIGTFTIGSISIGIFSLGAVSLGKYAVGALAVASHVAIGDHAYGHIAIGRVAEGIRAFIETAPRGSIGSNIDKEAVRIAILQEFPDIKDWILRYLMRFIKWI